MKKVLLLTGITATLLTFNAHATDIKPYIEGRISQNWTKAEYKENGFEEKFKDNALGGSLEIGAKLDQFRIGFEGYYNDDIKDNLFNVASVKGEAKGLFLNGYYDIPVAVTQIKPYVGFGIGYSWLKETVDMIDYSAKDKDFGWNVGFGIAYELNNNIDLTLGYRYEDLGKIKTSINKTDFTNHKVYLGLRYNF